MQIRSSNSRDFWKDLWWYTGACLMLFVSSFCGVWSKWFLKWNVSRWYRILMYVHCLEQECRSAWCDIFIQHVRAYLFHKSEMHLLFMRFHSVSSKQLLAEHKSINCIESPGDWPVSKVFKHQKRVCKALLGLTAWARKPLLAICQQQATKWYQMESPLATAKDKLDTHDVCSPWKLLILAFSEIGIIQVLCTIFLSIC